MDEHPDVLLVRAEAAYRYAVADPASAGPGAAALVAEARDCGDVESLVVALRAQAWSARTLLAGEQAKDLLDEAARLARRAGLDIRLGEVLVTRAAVNQELGRARATQRDLDHARPLLGASALAQLEFQTAVLHQNAGRLADAGRIYRRILADKECPTDIRAKASNNLGMIEADFGHYGAALALLDDACGLALEVGPALTAYFVEGQATVTAQAGMLPASLDLFAQAERLYEIAGLPRAELYAEYADAMADLRLLPEASSAAERALVEFAANGIPLMRAEAELRVARLALLAGRLGEAEAAASTAAADLRRQGRSGWAASADVVRVDARARAGTASLDDLRRVRRAASTLERLNMTSLAVEAHVTAGGAAVALDRTDWAVSSYERAAQVARHSSVLIRLKGRLASANAAGLRGDLAHSLQHCRSGLTDLELHRGVLASTELRVLASAHGAELGQIGLRTLMAAGSELDVFHWLERTRAAALVAVQRIPAEGFEEELAQLRTLQAELDSVDGGSPEQVARHTALEQRLRRLTWATTAAASGAARALPITEIRAPLDGRLLVEYGVLDGQVFAAVVSARRVTITSLAPVEAVATEVEKLLFTLRMLSRQTPVFTAGGLRPLADERLRRLRALLTDPLQLPPDAEIVVVPVGVLQRVPWSALHDGPVSLAPSASFWVRAGREPRPAHDSVVLAAGPGLPGAADEVVQLAALDERSTLLLPPDSTVGRVAAALQGAGLVHFACHGDIRSDNPMFSGLMLCDGSLTVQELELRDIAPYRVVLAACEAAADVAYPGGEMLGFVSALLARGTAGLVASIIVVPDVAAPALMVGLHEHLRGGQTQAVALHAARAELDLDDAREFVNWCGFTAFGAA